MGRTWICQKLILCQKSDCLDCCRAGLGYRLGDILWSLAYTGEKYTCCRRLYRTKLCMGFCQEVVGINAGCQHGGNLSHIRIRFDGRRQDYHIRFFQDLLIIQKICSLDQQFPIWLRNHFSYLPFDIIHSVLFYGSSVKLIKILARRTHINIENGYIHIRIFIPDQHGVLCRIHTADLRAVTLASVICTPAAHTLDKYHLFRSLSVRQPFQMSSGWSCRIHDTLQFQGRDHVPALTVRIFVIIIQFDHIKSGCHYDGSIFLCDNLILLLIINSSGLADL